jgi:hypothetical protein
VVGADATLRFAITAPTTPGDYVLGARMVRDGVAWFGDTFGKSIHVAAGAGTGGNGGTPEDGTGGDSGGANPGGGAVAGSSSAHSGCSIAARSIAGGLVFPIALLVCAVAIFRYREKPLV